MNQHELIDNELDDYSKIMNEMMARKESGGLNCDDTNGVGGVGGRSDMIDIQNDADEIANRKELARVMGHKDQYSSESATKTKEGSRYVLEGRRKGESMKQFKYRIKQETRKVNCLSECI